MAIEQNRALIKTLLKGGFMKTYLISLVCILTMVCPAYSNLVTGIDISSEVHHVWGSAPTEYNKYDLLSDHAVRGETGIAELGLEWGEMGLQTYGISYTDYFLVNAYSSGFQSGLTTVYAQIDYTFKPLADRLITTFTGYSYFHEFETWVYYRLIDVTTGITLDDRTWATDSAGSKIIWYPSALPDSASYDVFTDHTYLMTMGARAKNADGYSKAQLEIGIRTEIRTPEPATILLLGLGGLLLGKIRKR
jgi:hypothetical protein